MVCKTVYCYVDLKLQSIEKRRGLSPGPGFLYFADMSITVTKEDLNQPANLISDFIHFRSKQEKKRQRRS